MKDYTLSEIRAINEAYYRNSSVVELLYRGMDKRDSDREDFIWTTDDVGYAKAYAVDKENPGIAEFGVDRNELKCATLSDLDSILGGRGMVEPIDVLDGFDEEDVQTILDNGYNSVYFDWEGHGIFLLLNKDMLVSRRFLSDEEYDKVEVDY